MNRARAPAPFLEPHSRYTRASELHRAVRDVQSKATRRFLSCEPPARAKFFTFGVRVSHFVVERPKKGFLVASLVAAIAHRPNPPRTLPQCYGMCECAGGACSCHASNVRKMRKVKSALRKQANLREAEVAKSRLESLPAPRLGRPPSAAAPGFASAPSADAPKPASALSCREQIQLFDAKHSRDENAREQRREPYSVFPEAPRSTLRGSASRESDSLATSPSASGARASTESDDDGFAPEDTPAPHGAVPTMTIAEETMFLDVLMMNERLVEENEWLRNKHESASPATSMGDFAGEGANTDVLDEHVSNAAPESYEIDKLDLLEGFATHPEMGAAALRSRAVVLMENPGVGATRKRPSLFDDAARKLERSDAPRPRPVCETSDARAAFVRTLWYAWRLFCFALLLGFVTWAAARIWLTSEASVCGTPGAGNESSSALWSMPVLLNEQLHIDSWKMSCGAKRVFIVIARAAFAVAWYALCLQAWMGFRFARAYVTMWRLERRHAAAAARSAADAKAEALRGGLDVMSIAALARQQSGGVVSITWPRWDRRSAEGSDSDESFTDSARGESAV